jgi:hypothetical protein
MTNYNGGTHLLNGGFLGTVTASANPNQSTPVIFNLSGFLSTFNISSAPGSTVQVNDNFDIGNTLNLSTAGGNLDLASSVGALGTTNITINGGSFTIASSLLSVSVLSNATLTFGASGGTSVFGDNASLVKLSLLNIFNPILGFTNSTDILDDRALNFSDVTSYTISAVNGQAGVEKIVVSAGKHGSFTFEVKGSNLGTGTFTPTNGPLYLVSDGHGGTDVTVCFCAGTAIATPEGEVAVETLKEGDLVLTADGRSLPIRWMGQSHVARAFADPIRSYPIRITAGALGENLPKRDLRVSPEHGIFINGILVQASALVNDETVLRETSIPDQFTYYHVELATHELLLTEGVPTESFVDNVDRMNFHNWDARTAPDEPIAEMSYPRAKSARQVPSRIHAELLSRASGRTAA